MFPQFTQNFDFPPASTNDLNDEKVFCILSFHPCSNSVNRNYRICSKNEFYNLTHNLVYEIRGKGEFVEQIKGVLLIVECYSDECFLNKPFIFSFNCTFAWTSPYSSIAFFSAESCCLTPNCFAAESISITSQRSAILESLN
jgi:hypothetical protein